MIGIGVITPQVGIPLNKNNHNIKNSTS